MKRNVQHFFLMTFLFLLCNESIWAERGIKVLSNITGSTLNKLYTKGNNYAIIIGINKYQLHTDLKTAVNDT